MKIGDIFKKALPFLSAAASGNVPGLLAMAANTVGQAIGKKVGANQDSIAEALTGATPEQLLQLKELEGSFKERMAALGFENAQELERLAAEDRTSARARQVAVRDKIPAILAIFITLGFFSVLGLMLFKALPVDGHDALLVMLGALGTAWISIVTYYFGSSAGSARKTEVLAGHAPYGDGADRAKENGQ